MAHIQRALILAGIIAAITPAARAMTVDEVIDRHIAAHGGRAACDKLTSMRVTGEFTAFSRVSPFTMHKARGRKYHMDHVLDGKKVVIGYDGKMAWWDNRWFQEGAQEMGEQDALVVMRDVDFLTPFFDVEDEGHEVTLIGETEFEGMPAIGLELTRADDSKETWYLDPETYLEMARLSPGSDFGRPMEQRTFFDDFRDVGGVTIAHHTETQWYTRDRMMRIDKIEPNVALDPAMFRMPAPMGMEAFQDLGGEWMVKAKVRQQPGGPQTEHDRTATIELRLKGAMLEEQFKGTEGESVIRTLSYDRYAKAYRLSRIDDRTTYLDIMQGDWDEAKARLTLSNLETGTKQETFGMTIHERLSLFDVTADGFKLEHEATIDGGESWFTAVEATYTRPPARTAETRPAD